MILRLYDKFKIGDKEYVVLEQDEDNNILAADVNNSCITKETIVIKKLPIQPSTDRILWMDYPGNSTISNLGKDDLGLGYEPHYYTSNCFIKFKEGELAQARRVLVDGILKRLRGKIQQSTAFIKTDKLYLKRLRKLKAAK